jgi:uncharacterized membrane protein YccC
VTVVKLKLHNTVPIGNLLRLNFCYPREKAMHGWRDKAHRYRELVPGAITQQAREMLAELAQEAEAIAEDIDRLPMREPGNAEQRPA